MKKNTILFTVLFCVLVVSAELAAMGGGGEDPLENSHPIVLSHGMLGFADDPGMLGGLVTYWGGMDDYLREQGAEVFMPAKSALNSHEVRAEQAREQILMWMASEGHSQVNIIAHSQGAPDSRYMISNLGMASKVRSLVSLNGVNYGGSIASDARGQNLLLDVLVGLIWLDPDQDFEAAMNSIAVENYPAFNAANPNIPGVNYFSYGSIITEPDFFQHGVMALLYETVGEGGAEYGLGYANDGLVNLESMKWGTWMGGPYYPPEVLGIDHLQATNFNHSGETRFDVQGYFLDMATLMMNQQ